MTKNTKAGLWMGVPWAILLASILAWAVIWKTILAFGGYDNPGILSLARLANIVLGFVSILSIVMVPVGLIVGIVIVAKGGPKT